MRTNTRTCWGAGVRCVKIHFNTIRSNQSHSTLPGCLIRRLRLHSAGAAAALGAIYQFEEVASLWLMARMGVVPFRYLVLKEDTSENELFFKNTLYVALGLGLLFMVPPLAANLYGDNGLFFWFRDLYAEVRRKKSTASVSKTQRTAYTFANPQSTPPP